MKHLTGDVWESCFYSNVVVLWVIVVVGLE